MSIYDKNLNKMCIEKAYLTLYANIAIYDTEVIYKGHI